MKKRKPLLLLVVISLNALSLGALACQVPVFRYALERWPADNYQIAVVHEGAITAKQELRVQTLIGSDFRPPASANFTVKLIEAAKTKDQVLQAAWKKRGKSSRPIVVTLFPETAREIPDRLVSAVPLSDAVVDHLVESPVRETIAKRLVSGESAVWIFVPCGDEEKDKVARETLDRVVKLNEATLELPEQEEIEDEKELLEQVDIELRLDFSIITLNRDDPREQFLLQMLLASEPDLEELDEPMAFPVLGRGRVLYALVGKGIAEETITAAARFIIGPCSCQVKNQNPGFDLLMDTDWDERIGKRKLSDPMPRFDKKPVLVPIPSGYRDP